MFLLFVSSLAIGSAAQLPPAGSETVHSVAHVKAGHETEYAALSPKAWDLYRKLQLVLDHPHVVLKGSDEKGLPFFVEVFTWKSASVPENAPPEVKALW